MKCKHLLTLISCLLLFRPFPSAKAQCPPALPPVQKDTLAFDQALEQARDCLHQGAEADSILHFITHLESLSATWSDLKRNLRARLLRNYTLMRIDSLGPLRAGCGRIVREASLVGALTEELNARNLLHIYYAMNGKNDSAAYVLWPGLAKAEQVEKHNAVVAIANNLAVVYGDIGDLGKSLEIRRKAYAAALNEGNPGNILFVCSNLAVDFSRQEIPDSTIHYAKKALVMARDQGNLKAEQQSLNNLSGAMALKGDFKAAIEYADRGIAFGYMNNPGKFVDMHCSRGEALLGLNRPQDAILDGEKALEYAIEEGELPTMQNPYILLSKAYKATGDYKTAMKYQDLYYVVRDSITEYDTRKAVSEYQVRYQTEKQQHEIDQLAKTVRIRELTLHRNRLIGLAALALGLLLILGGSVFFVSKVRTEREKARRIKGQLLRSQMNPHFIFNVMAAIQSGILRGQEPKLLVSAVARFGKLMRLSLNLSNVDMVSLEEEIEFLETYFGVQAFRSENRFTFELEVEEEIDQQATMVPPLLILPFLENAISQGLAGIENGVVRVQFKQIKDRIEVEIRDNGGGTQKEKNPQKILSSISTIRQRLNLLDRKRTRLDFMESGIPGEGTRVAMVFPLMIA